MPAVTDPSALSEIRLFQGLELEELARLNALLHRKIYPTGTTIISADQPGEVAYIIMSGTAKVHVEQADGRDVMLAILGRGELVGELSIVDRLARSGDVVTLEESTLCWIDRTAFEQCLKTMPLLTFNLVRILAGRLRVANTQIQSLATQDVFGRVACLLLAFAENYGETTANGDILIRLHLTQTDLASLVGASRMRVNHVLGFYKERGSISLGRSYITIHDRAALSQRCQ